MVETGIENRWKLFDTVPEIIDEKFEYGREYATNAFRIANETIQRLSELSTELDLIDTNVVIPDITPPVVTDFVSAVPTAPTIELNLPDDLTLVSEVDSAIHDKLLSDIISGSPAIPANIEAAVFNRETERALLVHRDTIDRINAEWSKRGFTLPNAFLASLISQAEIDYANKRLDISRDIAIKSFELSDTNTKFAIERGITWYGNKIEVFKVKTQGEIARIDAIIKKFIGEVEVYKGSAEVFVSQAETRIKLFDSQVRSAVARADLIIKNAEVEMKNYEAINKLKIASMDAIAGVAAQLIAGALSSVSASASISASDAGSYSYSSSAVTVAEIERDSAREVAQIQAGD